jgi:RecA/RadA recombinase
MDNRNLFGNLLENDGMYQASSIVEDMSIKVPQREPFYSSSPTNSWGSAVGYMPGMMELMYGPKSSGKTMIVLDRIKQSQKVPGTIQVFVDAELGFEYESTIRWMRANGVDTSRVLIVRDVCIKKIFETHFLEKIQKELLAGNVQINYSCLDSVQATSVNELPKTEAQIKKAVKDDSYTKQDYGARANYLSRIFPAFRMFCRDYRIFHTFIGQARSGGTDRFGNIQWTTNGGEALFHEVQYRTLVTPWGEPVFSETQGVTGKPVKIGHRVKFKFEKNKAGEGHDREGFCDIEYMKGIVNVENELVVLASKLGIINQGGAWLDYEGQKFNGINKFVDHLKNDKDLYDEIFNRVMMSASTRPDQAVVFDENTGEILDE